MTFNSALLPSKFQLYLLAAVMLLLTGCETFVKVDVDSSTDATEQQQLKQIVGWDLRGKVGVIAESEGGTATILWSRDTQGIEKISIYGFLGAGRINITNNAGDAVLIDSKGRTFRGLSSEAVIQQRLGWQIPFDDLSLWARGLAGPNTESFERGAGGRLQKLSTPRWQVDFASYQEVIQDNETYNLPRKITILAKPGQIRLFDENDNYLGDKLSIKVIFSQWRDIIFSENK